MITLNFLFLSLKRLGLKAPNLYSPGWFLQQSAPILKLQPWAPPGVTALAETQVSFLQISKDTPITVLCQKPGSKTKHTFPMKSHRGSREGTMNLSAASLPLTKGHRIVSLKDFRDHSTRVRNLLYYIPCRYLLISAGNLPEPGPRYLHPENSFCHDSLLLSKGLPESTPNSCPLSPCPLRSGLCSAVCSPENLSTSLRQVQLSGLAAPFAGPNPENKNK